MIHTILLLIPALVPVGVAGYAMWRLGDWEWWRAAMRLSFHRRLSSSMCRCSRCDCDRWRIGQQMQERARGLRR